MKKTLLIVTGLVLALCASSAIAANTDWAGTYWDPAGTANQGTWTGTLYVDDPSGIAPYFEGEWVSDFTPEYGTLYATILDDGSGIYTVIKGVIYAMDGTAIGNWTGSFDLISSIPGNASGKWKLFSDPSLAHYGLWKGKQVF